ncbi:hypothetical protein [Vibrio sonorensis]|uniref:hypothetical protein n=1 Tax=Vibrio sonorensis TaxID=1004316 RepID=UPI0008D9929F|nr:hypothetical protein [Vibrio sonorensis]
MNKCALCGSEAKLELSHILPKFFFRYLKKSSPTGNIRSTSNPNRIIQDGEKVPFLCGECEDLFSRWETSFANNIFYPYEKGEKSQFSYNSDLSKFLASLSFRCLKLAYTQDRLENIDENQVPYVSKALDNLANYLLGNNPHPKEQRQFLVLLDTAESHSGYVGGIKESEFNLYATRAIEYDVVANDIAIFIYIKFLKFLVLCPVYIQSQKGWRSCRVNHRGGILKPSSIELNDYVLHRMINGARKAINSRESISGRQSDIIKKNLNEQQPEKLANSPIAQAILKSKA